jgi:hypothetical protein
MEELHSLEDDSLFTPEVGALGRKKMSPGVELCKDVFLFNETTLAGAHISATNKQGDIEWGQ